MAFQPVNFLNAPKQDFGIMQKTMGAELDNAFKRVQNKYAEPSAQANITLHNAQAQEHQIKARQMMQDIQLLNSIFGGQMGGEIAGQPSMNGAPQSMQQMQNMQPGMEQQVQNMGGIQGQQYGQPQTNQGLNLNNLTPAQLEIIRTRLKAGDRKYTTLPGGQTLMADPLLGDQVMQLGDTLQQAEHAKTMGKLNAEEFDKTQNALRSSLAKEPILRELMEAVNDPNFFKASGPLPSRIRGLTDDKEVNALAGKVDLLLGDLVNKSAQQFGSRLNQSEYKALQRMKGSTSENPHALKAKVMLMYAMDKFDRQVQSQYGRNLGKMDRQSALEKAYDNVDYSEIRHLAQMDNMAHQIASNSKSSYEDIMGAAQKFADATGGSVEDALAEMGKTYIKGSR